jgi:hypothetical protein
MSSRTSFDRLPVWRSTASERHRSSPWLADDASILWLALLPTDPRIHSWVPQARCCAYLAPGDLAVQAFVDTCGADPVAPSPLIVNLPAPLAHIVLGVNSHALDDAVSVGPLSDERVWRWLIGPPYPFALEHAESWTALQVTECAEILDELRQGVR